MEGQVIQQDDRMCSTEEDEKKEGKIYTHTLPTSGRLNIWELPSTSSFMWSGQCQGRVPVQGAEFHQPSATSHLG